MEKGDSKNYEKIVTRLTWLFIIALILLLSVHLAAVTKELKVLFSDKGQTLIKSFLFGALGAIISCSIFLTRDKETNKQLFLQDPTSSEIDLPDSLDVQMYFHRVVTSGVLAVLGTLILFAGLSYVDVKYSSDAEKLKYLTVVASMFIGLFQGKFMKFIDGLFDQVFRQNKSKPRRST